MFEVHDKVGEFRVVGCAALAEDDDISAPVAGCFFARAFAQKPGLGIAGALMGRIAALQAMKVLPAVALARSLRRLLLRAKTLHARPSFDQRPIHAEVLVAEPASGAGHFHDLGKENIRRGMTEQPLLVLAKSTRVKERAEFVRINVQEPLKEQIIAQALAKLPVTADTVESREHPRAEQALRRDGSAPFVGIEIIEMTIQLGEDRAHQALDLADGMLLGNAALDVEQREESSLGSMASSHS